jgi:hypothetical protein
MMFLALCALLAGCSSGPEVAPVSGKVTVGGNPLTKGKVTFKPNGARGNKSTSEPIASIDERGGYTLSTNGKPGAPLGWYKVIVPAGVPSNPKDPYSPQRWLVNRRYLSAQTTPLEVEVVADPPPGQYDLTLQR